jgi:hypothetical protein
LLPCLARKPCFQEVYSHFKYLTLRHPKLQGNKVSQPGGESSNSD